MNPTAPNPAPDAALWRLAERRVRFKGHLTSYVLVNALLWTLWALTGHSARPLPWPLFVGAAWGISLLVHGLGVYGRLGSGDQVAREYQRLLRQQ